VDRVSEREATRRVDILTKLAAKGRREYLERWLGREVELVVEAEKKLPNGFVHGLSENYLKLHVSCGKEPEAEEAVPAAGSLIRCRVLSKAECGPFDALAEIIPVSGAKAFAFP
jgi:tRNA A37 methylthiotransferase MiaB